MPFRSVLVSFAALALASSVSLAAHADDCTGWFCDDSKDDSKDDAKDDKADANDDKADPPVKPGVPGIATIPAGIPGLDPGVLSGTITELVPGDHLTLKLPNGELKTLKWGELLQLQVSGKIVISAGGSTTTHPPPAPSPPYTTYPTVPPPVVVVQPPPPKYAPPPAPNYLPPPPDAPGPYSPSPRDAFEERWALGLGLSFLSPNDRATFTKNGPAMRDYVGSGTGFEASLGYRISPSWTPYGFYEYSRFRPGAANADADSSSRASLLGLGIRANTNPDGPIGFFFDFGFGHRWLDVKSNGYDAQYAGWDYLRLGAGLSLNSSKHVRWHVAMVGTAGSFSSVKSSQTGRCSGPGCNEIPEADRGSYGFGGLTVGGQFDL